MSQFEKLTPLLKSFIEKGPAGCSLSVFQNRSQKYSNFVGFSDLENKTPITEDSIYRIYSMTKVVTCVAALILYEKGLFLLNDPIEEYLPEFKNSLVHRYTPYGALYTSLASKPITIKDLFTMSSGLTYAGDNIETARYISKIEKGFAHKSSFGEKYTIRDFSKAIATVPLAFDPGTHWQYGYSHDILGALIEVVSNKSLSQFFKDEIFDPLEMKDTFFRIPEDKLHRLCNLYNRSEDGILTKITNMDANYKPDAIFESGGAGLLSTLSDYSRFAQMLANEGELNGVKILSAKTVELMSINHLSQEQLLDFDWPYQSGYGYGLGVRVMIDKAKAGSNSSLGEFGWCGMAGTWVMIDPKEKLSAVYMQQMFPNFEAYHQPRLRNVIYGSL
ncbi:serine hydrolase [Clostridium zeae]|uniref:Serine hydrolase n=1 Tax=Clostridium zeae TaxID=2759022 RepID=A0ABQ1EBY0_9CLOT|nr:serine hydrolase domain-containing protein [Clostridium zeae]GFZ32244.1 serine hydrolase [Clostridium zeae]